jgi:hypothetical protein
MFDGLYIASLSSHYLFIVDKVHLYCTSKKTPAKCQVSKCQALKRLVSKRLVSKRLKRQVYKMSGLQSVRSSKRQVANVLSIKYFKTSVFKEIH